MNKIDLENKIKEKEKEKEIEILKEQIKNINKYESVLIINKNTTIEELQTVKNEIKEIIGDFERYEELGIKKLAYKIQENTEAFYIIFEFFGIGKDVEKLEKIYRLKDSILKYITMSIGD